MHPVRARARARHLTAIVTGLALSLLAVLFAFDFFGSKASAKQYDYDDRGRLVRFITPNGRAIKYSYNQAGAVTEISHHRMGAITRLSYPASNTTRFEYDAVGNLLAIKDATGRTRYGYDEWNRLTQTILPDGKKLSAEYDSWGQVRRLVLPDGSAVRYSHDAQGGLMQFGDGQGDVYYEIRGDARRLYRRLPNGVLTVYESSAAGQLTALRHLNPDGGVICAYAYEYDPEGRINAIAETSTRGTATTRYEYDLLGRLAKLTPPDGLLVSYDYDAMGNRTAETGGAGTVQYSYDAQGRLLRAGETTFTYDAAGNLIARKDRAQRVTYEYDDENQLIAVRTGQTTVRYTYDGAGNRVRREVNGKVTNYLNDFSAGMPQVVGEYGKDGKLAHYLLGKTRVGRRDAAGEAVYFLEDHLGSTRCVVDGAGQVLARYDYTPFGEPKLVEGTPQTEFLYAGEQWDQEAHLLYLRARFYDPQTGRFLSADPLPGSPLAPQSFNRYAYADNDPINQVDPLGLQGWPPPFYNPNRDIRRYIPPIPQPTISNPNHLSWWDNLNRGTYFGTGLGDTATQYWAQRYVETGQWGYVVPGLFSSLWTPQTWKQTALVLATPAISKLVGDALLSKGLQPLARREPFHLGLGDYIHYGVDIERGPHIGIGWERRAFLHFYEEHINIGGARGLDLPVDWRAVAIGGYSLFERGLDAFSQWRERHFSDSPALDLYGAGSLDQKRGMFFPPPGGGGGGMPAVGGVYLDQTAKVIGELGRISGAIYDPAKGQLVLVGDKNTELPPMRADYLAAALRAAYSESPHEPGMTIDPNPQNPRGPVMLVIFFGNTENTRLGWTMFEADRVMKGYSVGSDNLSKRPVQSAVADYQSVTAMGLRDGVDSPGLWSRFWLVPEPVTARVSGDGQMILFDPIKMRVKTETMRLQGGKLIPAGDVKDAHAEAFAAHFTSHYDEFARENPIYAELQQVTQAVALAKWMRQQGVPLDWNLVRGLGGSPYPTPQTTPSAYAELQRTYGDGLRTGIRKVSSFGGVEMAPQLQPQKTADAEPFYAEAKRAWAEARRRGDSAFSFKAGGKPYQAVALPTDRHEAAGHMLAVSDQPDCRDAPGMGEIPGLSRYYSSLHNEPTEFGFSWSRLSPRLEFESLDEPGRVRYISVAGDAATQVQAQRFVLTDPFGMAQTRFDQQFIDPGLNRIGFAPAQPSSGYRAIYPESDGSYRLVTTGGWQALFDARGNLRALLRPDSKALYDYDNRNRLGKLRLVRGDHEQEINFTYDDRDRLVTSDACGLTTTYHYDLVGDLISVRSGQHTTDYRYDDRHLLTEVRADGQVTEQNAYDEAGRLVKQTTAAGALVEWRVEESPEGQIITHKEAGVAIRQHYDQGRRLVAVEDDLGGSAKYAYDETGRITSIDTTLPGGGRARMEVSPDRRRVLLTDPRGVHVQYHLEADGQVSEIRVNDQTAAAYHYNERRQLVEVNYRGGDGEQYQYDAGGKVVQYRRVSADDQPATQQALTYTYDEKGSLTGIDGPPAGRVSLSREPQAIIVAQGTSSTIYRYDERGRLRRLEGPEGLSVTYSYAAGGALQALDRSQAGATYRVEAAEGDTIISHGMRGQKMKYDYTPAGQLSLVEDPYGNQTLYTYDDANRLRQVKLPSGVCLEYTYDRATGKLRQERRLNCRQ
ncbi:MAG TPA: RHS repeat-associated core domain-containing protein [Blastocatellia bacterium]|nr:RHS repeat-associated core domain-containing protein [Blastocatellia bacterium]